MTDKAGRNIVALLRAAMLGLAIVLQVGLMLAVSLFFADYSVAFTFVVDIASALIVLRLISSREDPSYRIAWLAIVLLMPVFGLLLYLAWGWAPLGVRVRKHIRRAFGRAKEERPDDSAAREALAQAFPDRARVSGHLSRVGFPVYRNTAMAYYAQGEDFFDALCADIERAERFIFMEFFIVDCGQVWDRIYEILRRKVKQGVKVRLLYDDAGCLFTLKRGFAGQLEEAGIQVKAFGNVQRYISELHINYRNHQKIAVIDGDIGFAGGVNIADEYANLISKLGHWKDTAVRLEGEAVWSLTTTFLCMWDLAHQQASDDYALYMPTRAVQGTGFCQPVSDGPANNPNNPIEDMYRQVIGASQRYCYITTPYLVIDSGMTDALRLAALSGVDVRIYTPGIPDHWYVHPVTQSFYGNLLKEGVRIFEYTPGFLHAKMVVSDDEIAIVGSVNMDFRSFYLHYENAVLSIGDPVAGAVRDDILSIQSRCGEITYEAWKRRPLRARISGYVLRAFSTLM